MSRARNSQIRTLEVFIIEIFIFGSFEEKSSLPTNVSKICSRRPWIAWSRPRYPVKGLLVQGSGCARGGRGAVSEDTMKTLMILWLIEVHIGFHIGFILATLPSSLTSLISVRLVRRRQPEVLKETVSNVDVGKRFQQSAGVMVRFVRFVRFIRFIRFMAIITPWSRFAAGQDASVSGSPDLRDFSNNLLLFFRDRAIDLVRISAVRYHSRRLLSQSCVVFHPSLMKKVMQMSLAVIFGAAFLGLCAMSNICSSVLSWSSP